MAEVRLPALPALGTAHRVGVALMGRKASIRSRLAAVKCIALCASAALVSTSCSSGMCASCVWVPGAARVGWRMPLARSVCALQGDCGAVWMSCGSRDGALACLLCCRQHAVLAAQHQLRCPLTLLAPCCSQSPDYDSFLAEIPLDVLEATAVKVLAVCAAARPLPAHSPPAPQAATLPAQLAPQED